MSELCKLYYNILHIDELFVTKLLLYGDSKYRNKVNKKILLALQILRSDMTFFLKYVCLQFYIYASLHGYSKVVRSCF